MNRNLDNILAHNEHFVVNKEYEKYATSKFPEKKMVILTCMDTRLTELLPKAMNLKNGDAKIIKNAGAIVLQPFGNIMRSILVALYALKAEEVVVVGHHDCGMTGLNSETMLQKMYDRGIAEDTVTTLKHAGIHLNRWLIGFDNVRDGVVNSVEIIRNHPLLPKNVPVHGLIIDPHTGALDLVINGYEY
ncbi:carbonic anhydrase [Xylanibacillus composti]|uniref:carbonic anhydrase n=1 Tax=Xylanibacillus composti TaxID=1572762 RepID=A0A8J4GYQ2_9BACL|nr:carbonic anhydrase [Xylanibacillus composti]MDT9725570.1 carbonic anhydrase [Xylanibacillus composti]GIQ67663.1 putative carbonic anhydrase YvdA [Xylanibacillus composti]